MWALLASLAAAGAIGGAGDPVLQRAVAAGDAARVLVEAASAGGVAIALDPRDLAGLRMPALRRGEHLRRALARICPAAGLICRVEAMGVVVRRGTVLRPAPAPAPATVEASPILVTGRHGTGVMLESERSFSLSRLSAQELRHRPPLTMADMLVSIPGLWIDTSAGTSANIARLRGIPMDGYTAMAVEEDGLPIQHTSLPWSDIDQFIRPDIMLESVDYVRGGPSGVLASNAPGGILDLHLRRAPDHAAGEARITATDYGLARVDGWIGGPVGGWRLISGGYIARDPTLRHIAQILGGGQIRLRATHDLPDGNLTLTARYQDDASLNTSSYPMVLNNGHWSALPGFDPRRGSWFGPDFNTVRFITADGPVTRPVGRNNRNRAFDLSGALVSGGWTARLRLRRSDTQRNAILSSGAPMTISEFMSDQGANYVMRRSDGALLPPSALVEVVQPASATVQLDEMIAQVERTERLGPHNLAGGLYAVVNRWRYQRIVARALVEARSQGLLVDALGVNGAAALTEGGYLSRASTWEQTLGRTASLAAYASDEWQIGPRWRIDAGLRHEWEVLRGIVGNARTADLSTPASLANRAAQVDSGQSTAYASSFAATNATLALHWQARPETLGLFARVSMGHVLPSVGAYRTSSAPAPAHLLDVAESEVGLVLTQGRVRLGLTGFANRFRGLDVSASVIDAVSGAITLLPRQASSHNLGIEAEVRLPLTRWAQVQGALTWQQSRLSDYQLADYQLAGADYDGHVPQRIPDIMAHGALNLSPPGAPWHVGVDMTAMGRRFADDANSLRLPPYVVMGLQFGWDLAKRRSAQGGLLRGRIDGEIGNLTDTIAVMQGDAIAGNTIPSRGSAYAIGRTLAGRSLRLSYNVGW